MIMVWPPLPASCVEVGVPRAVFLSFLIAQTVYGYIKVSDELVDLGSTEEHDCVQPGLDPNITLILALIAFFG